MKPDEALSHLMDEVESLTAAITESAEWLSRTLAWMGEVRADLGQLLVLDHLPELAINKVVSEIKGHFATAASAALCGAEDAEQYTNRALYALEKAGKREHSCEVGNVLYQVLDATTHTWIAKEVGETALAATTVDGLVGLVRYRQGAKPTEAVTPAELRAPGAGDAAFLRGGLQDIRAGVVQGEPQPSDVDRAQ